MLVLVLLLLQKNQITIRSHPLRRSSHILQQLPRFLNIMLYLISHTINHRILPPLLSLPPRLLDKTKLIHLVYHIRQQLSVKTSHLV